MSVLEASLKNSRLAGPLVRLATITGNTITSWAKQ